MTIEQIIKSGDKEKIEAMNVALDNMKANQINSCMRVIRFYNACRIIVLLCVCVMILIKY